MKQKINKAISLVLVLSMVMTMLSTTAFAAGYAEKLKATSATVELNGEESTTVSVSLISSASMGLMAIEGYWDVYEVTEEEQKYLTLSAIESDVLTFIPNNADKFVNVSNGYALWSDDNFVGVGLNDGTTVMTATYTVAADTPAGEYTVRFRSEVLTGDDYTPDTTVTYYTATITVKAPEAPKPPLKASDFTVENADKVYDGTTNVPAGFVFKATSHADAVVSYKASYDSKDAGARKIKISDLVLADGYELDPTVTADLQFDGSITAANFLQAPDAAALTQNIIAREGNFTEPVIKGVGTETATGTLAYTYKGNPNPYTYAELVDVLKTEAKDTVANVGYTFTANGNYDGIVKGNLTLTVVDVEFTVNEGAITVEGELVYGVTWDDIVTVDGDKITATLNGQPVEGEYSVLNGKTMPDAGDQTYAVIFTDNNGKTYTVKTGTVTIDKKIVTVTGVEAADKVYDGTTKATVNTNDIKLVGLLPEHEGKVRASVHGTYFVSKNVGNDKIVKFSVIPEDASDEAIAKNYIALTGAATASITPAPLTVTGVEVADKEYDGTIAATITGTPVLNGVVTGDTIILDSITAEFTDANAGENKAVTITDVELSGLGTDNYTLRLPTDITAEITPKPVSVKSVTASSKIYNGKTDTPAMVIFDGTVGSDFIISTENGVFVDGANAGENKTVNVTVTITNSNYVCNEFVDGKTGTVTTTATILPQNITISIADIPAQEYTGAEIKPDVKVTFEDAVEGETPKYTVSYENNINVGTATVTVTDNDDNYDFTPAEQTFRILPKVAEIPTAAQNLTYNGKIQTGVAAGEGYTVISGAAINAGEYTAQLTLKPGYVWADGTEDNKNITWSIAKKNVTVENVQVAEKQYNTLINDAKVTVTLSGAVDGETLDYTVTGTYANANAGTQEVTYTVTLNAGAENYTFTSGNTFTGTANGIISPKTLELSTYSGDFHAYDKEYDGTTTTTAWVREGVFTNVMTTMLMSGRDFTVSAAFDDANVGTAKRAVITITITNPNYVLPVNTHETTASITPKAIAVTIGALPDKEYTGDPIEFTKEELSRYITAEGLIEGDTLEYSISHENNVNVGEAAVSVASQDGGNYTFTAEKTFRIVPKVGTVDITNGDAMNITYGTALPDVVFEKNNPDGRVTVTYYADAACQTAIDKPVNAGTYWVKAAMAADQHYGAAEDVVSFTIAPKALEANMFLRDGIFHYDGSEKEASFYSELKKDVDYTLSGELKATNAGTYTAIATGMGNYIGTAQLEWTISKGIVVLNVEIESWTYGETPNKPRIFGKLSDATPIIEYKVSGADDSTYTTTVPTDADAYVCRVTLPENSNYPGSSKEAYFHIKYKPITADMITVGSHVYNGELQTVDVTVQDGDKTLVMGTDYELIGDAQMKNAGTYTFKVRAGKNYTTAEYGGIECTWTIAKADHDNMTAETNVLINKAQDVSYDLSTLLNGIDGARLLNVGVEDNDDLIAAQPTIEGMVVTFGVNSVDTAGVTAKLFVWVETTNYNKFAVELTITTVDKTPVVVSGVSVDNKTYDGTAIGYTGTPVATLNDETVDVEFVYEWYKGSELLSGAPTNAGTDYKLVVKVDDELYMGQMEIPFTINKAEVAVPTAVTGLEYNGQTQTGVVVAEDALYTAEDNTAINAGNYTATVTLNDAANYKWASDFSGSITWSIAKAQIVAPAADETEFVYNGNEQTYVIAENDAYKVEGNKQTNARTYTVTVALVDKANTAWANGSTDDLTFEFVIAKLQVEKPAQKAPVTYNGEAQTYGVVGNAHYTVKGETTATDADTYNVTIELMDKNNTTWADGTTDDLTHKFVINKKTVEAPKQCAPVVYNGYEQTYGVAPTADYTVENVTRKDAGSQDVTIKLKDQSGNVVWKSSGEKTDLTHVFTIAKANLTIMADDQEVMVGEKTLPELTYTIFGLQNGEQLKTEPTLTYETEPDLTKAAEIRIKASGAVAPDGNNYNEIGYVDGTLTIKAQPTSGDPTYGVVVDQPENGEIKLSTKHAEAGEKVTITVTPDEGYELAELIVTDRKGNEIELTQKGDNKFTFQMPAGMVKIEAIFEETEADEIDTPFIDVADGAYYYDAVQWAVENGITNGMSATEFGPNAICNRAQVVTFLWRAAGCPEPKSAEMPFADVPAGAYYYDAVLWAVENGITNGLSATEFAPNATVTRGQTVTFLWRAENGGAADGENLFVDVEAGAYYYDAVQWAVENGITNGMSANTFAPANGCTRGQIVTFLYRNFAE